MSADGPATSGSGDDLARKFDAQAATYSGRYADPGAIAAFFVGLVRGWGPPVAAGSTVLELGCADGFMTAALAAAGYRVTALDLSPAMIEATAARLERAGLAADLQVADVNAFEPTDHDVVLAPMWTFFHYVHDHAAVLRRLALATRVKLLVDANPRTIRVREAERAVRAAGFGDVRSRPVSVPQGYRLGPGARRAIDLVARTPVVGRVLLRHKLNVVVIGAR